MELIKTTPADPRPDAWIEMLSCLRKHGSVTNPRGERTIEIEDFHIDLDPQRDRFCTFKERALDLRYLAGEFGWYLGGDANDTIIEVLSKFWRKIKSDHRPYWNSNYGVPIFQHGQYDSCLQALRDDVDSRQAVMVISNSSVIMSTTKDKICTNAVMFRIRKNKLNMTVQMRSNDIIFGLCYDLPIFSFIMEMAWAALKGDYPDLELGTYHHTSGSFHIYEKHWGMMDQIVESGESSFYKTPIPVISSDDEVTYLMNEYPVLMKRALVSREPINMHPKYAFTQRLLRWVQGG